jgi:hypothetical protein
MNNCIVYFTDVFTPTAPDEVLAMLTQANQQAKYVLELLKSI